MQPLKTHHIHIFGSRNMIYDQNNKQNLQIWDIQISEIAKF